MSRDENQERVGIIDAKEERLKEGQWVTSLKADVKPSRTKIENIPQDLSTWRSLGVLIITVAAERKEWKPQWIVSCGEWG